MTSTADLLHRLHTALAAVYPTSRTASSHRGRVGCSVLIASGRFDDVFCEPSPVTVSAEIRIYAAGNSEQATVDLLTHLDPVVAIIRGAAWNVTDWQASAMEDNRTPYIAVTATAIGQG